MESTQIFMSSSGSSRKSLFGNNKEEVLVLKIEGTRISGKGYVCNEEGKNGYIDDFTFSLKEIEGINVAEYHRLDALTFNAQIKSLYGSKKVKIFLPNIKNVEIAMGELRKAKRDVEKGLITEPSASTPSAPAEPEVKAAPSAPVEPEVQVTPSAPAKAEAVEKVVEPEKIETVQTSVDNKIKEVIVPEKTETDKKTEMSKDEFKRRMDKLGVLKDCGLLEEKEYVSKKLELISELYDLKDFNEKLQKIIALKECGLLSDKEFDANRMDLIKECCDLCEADTEAYRRNIQKLAFMQIGEVISAEEYEKSKLILVRDVAFDLRDSNEEFIIKLKRLPVLKECQILTEIEYDMKIKDMLSMLEITKSDIREDIVDKLRKWPVLVQENYMDESELKRRQNQMISEYLDIEWETPGELKAVINKLSDLKEGGCLTDEEFNERREKILHDIDVVDDYRIRITMYKLLPQLNFISGDEFLGIKQKCIDQIFSKAGSVEEFKVRANNLVELQKVGILTDSELAEYKIKLMSEL